MNRINPAPGQSGGIVPQPRGNRSTAPATQHEPAPAASPAQPATVPAVTPQEIRPETGDKSAAVNDRPDRFIPSAVVSRDAVYNVSDITEGNSRTGAEPDRGYLVHGERIESKIVEIPLPLGRKSLSIFRTEPQE